ncbi:LamG-like jellyroll fold domain-containing protein [Halapricum hydrolyticum]|uniref:dolichyl-phosphooligosaccharide-protein glycotransferase n=1 Tax=Halapricum hydrolyticum TaxID=2979991 RepID=A0AAE3I9U3_9EURY|nr:LamG-like jellyroll fold domain-containing protein [Halapricum hydrolyticum]MCU4718169.1 laminin G [Halapricum hydrolyticum]MCU4726411.1 laminin G [Halapricum hydrolyticum]
MTDVRAAIESLLEDRPDLEDRLEDLLAVDAQHDTWTFEDVPFDSGTFGELVSREIVEKTDGEYRLRDPAAVEAILNPDAVEDDDTDASSRSLPDGPALSLPDIDRVTAIGLSGALALVVLFRVFPFPSVFQNRDVVLSGNDPYAYRYLVHQLLAESGGALDLSTLSELPGGIAHGEPLFVATLWWIAALFGGAADHVLAWYPVVSAVVTALLVYVLTVRVTDDRRVGIAAVALLAIVPGHAFRTGIGFADHHAFDYPWLALTALAVVSLADRELGDRGTWPWVLALGVGVSGQALAWDAGPLLLVPLAVYVALVVPSWVRAGRSPLHEGAGLVAGLALGATLVAGAHHAFGWHSTEVAAVPGLLLVGTIGLVALGTATERFDVGVRPLVGAEVGGLVVGVLVVRTLLPSLSEQLSGGIDFLLTTEGIAETTSIVAGRVGALAGPIFLFGFALFLAVPYLAWASWRCYRRHEPGLLAVSVYAWVFLVLGIVQARFAGQLAIFVAVFGGLGFVHLAAWVELTDYPELFGEDDSGPRESADTNESPRPADLAWPERREALYTAGLGLGIASLGTVMTPIKHSQVTIDDSIYEAAAFMREYADEQGWEYPDNYVFSRWGRNRVYNWFVNGESRSYGYAQSNYEDFVTSTDGTEWYERLGDRVGFIATGRGLPIDAGGRTIYERLWSENLGIETDHYRAVWATADDSRRVYTLVPGARVTGPAPAQEDVRIEGDVEIGAQTRSVGLDVSTGEHGVYQATIPLPGTYDAPDGTVEVSAADVRAGRLRSEFDGDAYARWSFDEGSGEWAYDRAGGHHGRVHGAEWADGREGAALSFEGQAEEYVEAPIDSLQEFTLGLWARPTALDVSGENDYRDVVRAENGSILIFEQNGRISFRLPGAGGGRVVGSGVETDAWTHVAVTFDGTTRTIYVDGAQVAQDDVSVGSLEWGESVRFGNRYSTPSRHGYAGRLADVRIYEGARSDISAPFGLE